MPMTMPTLKEMNCAGGEAIWKEYQRTHLERIAPIVKTLNGAAKKCFDFSFTGSQGKKISFCTSYFAKIAHDIEFGKINVKLAPELFYNEPAGVAAAYMPDWDMLLVKDSLFPVDLHDHSLVVHEAVHMINDREQRTLPDIDNETMAYLVQAMYHRGATAFQNGATGKEVGQALSAPQPETAFGLKQGTMATYWDQYTHDLAGNPLTGGTFLTAQAKFTAKDKTKFFPRDSKTTLAATDYPLASPNRFVDRNNRPMSIAFNYAFLTVDALRISWRSEEAAQVADFFAGKLRASLLLTTEYKGTDKTTAPANGIKTTKHWSE